MISMTPPMADMDKDCMGYALCPDAMTDEKKAMASVNGKMVVKSSHDAILTPMWMDPVPNGVGVTGGMDNMPFQNIDWKAMQSEVVGMGVTFKATRVSVGAGQEAVPESEVMHITCGPFHCSEASMEKPMAPEITIADSAVCASWAPDMELQVGMIDNDLATQRNAGAQIVWKEDEGIDLGWVSTSSVDMTVKHVFSGPEMKNYRVTGPNAVKGTNKPVPMDMMKGSAVDKTRNNRYEPGIGNKVPKATTDGTDPGDNAAKLADVCLKDDWYSSTSGRIQKPDQCFRVRKAGGHTLDISLSVLSGHYLSGYGVEVSPVNGSVSWGKVKWEKDPFKDLKCEPKTFMAADQVDVCQLFEEEVDHALSGGWGSVDFDVTGTDLNAKMALWRVSPKTTPTPHRFKKLFFDDNLNGKLNADAPSIVISGSGASATYSIDAGKKDLKGGTGRWASDFYNIHVPSSITADSSVTTMREQMVSFVWMSLMDADQDPTMGDFGKVDLGVMESNAIKANSKPDKKADNYADGDDAQMCSDADGAGCDAKFEMDYTLKFADGLFDCKEERTLTLSCEWDAQGILKTEMNKGNPTTASVADKGKLGSKSGTLKNVHNFAECKVTMN